MISHPNLKTLTVPLLNKEKDSQANVSWYQSRHGFYQNLLAVVVQLFQAYVFYTEAEILQALDEQNDRATVEEVNFRPRFPISFENFEIHFVHSFSFSFNSFSYSLACRIRLV